MIDTCFQIGVSLDGLIVKGLVFGGPAYNCGQFGIGDAILQIDNSDASPENVDDLLRGDDIPGSYLSIKIRKASASDELEVKLQRMPSAVISRHFEIFQSFQACMVLFP